MCDAGPVVKHLMRVLPDPNSTVILTGYQAQGTIGSKLMGLKNGEAVEDKPLSTKLQLLPQQIKATTLMIRDYSGHADTEGLLNYLFNTERGYCPAEIHLNHGDNKARETLEKSILCRHTELERTDPGKFTRPVVRIPEKLSTYVMRDGVLELEQSTTVRHNNVEAKILETLVAINERLQSIENGLNTPPTRVT